MRPLARPLVAAGRVTLADGWQIGRVESIGIEPHWRSLPQRLPLAAALAHLGEPVLDGAARDLDAERWCYRLGFDAPASAKASDWVLGLDGLATIAHVSLNGEPLLSSANMFRSHELRLGERLRPQGNELRIVFDPLAEALKQRRPRPRWRAPMVAHPQLRWWRTTLLGRTPGWSPNAAPVGPWGEVWLEPLTPLRPARLELHTERQGTRGRLQLAVGFEAGTQAARTVRVRLERGGRVLEAEAAVADDGLWRASLDVPQVALWWPHTHGEPTLYRVSLLIVPQGASATEAPQVLTIGRVGFRSIEVNQQDGGFQLVVNDVPVFARGACWMPLDPLTLHATSIAYDMALSQVCAAGLNMLHTDFGRARASPGP